MQKGTKHTDETKAKMSATRKGRVFSEEHRAALTAASRKRWARVSAEQSDGAPN